MPKTLLPHSSFLDQFHALTLVWWYRLRGYPCTRQLINIRGYVLSVGRN